MRGAPAIQRSVEYGIECWLADLFGYEPGAMIDVGSIGPLSITALAEQIVEALFQANDVLVATNPKVGQRGSTTVGDTYRFKLNR